MSEPETPLINKPATERRSFSRSQRLTAAGLVVAAVAIGALIVHTVPSRPVGLLTLLVLLYITVWRSSNPVARVVFDWLPVLIIVVGYDLIRSQAPSLVDRAITEPQLRVDEFIFGGSVPTVRLQHLMPPSRSDGSPSWWDYFLNAIYITHFIVTPAIAIWIYLRHREWFSRFAALIVGVTLAGFITYLALPAVPPWLASRQGDLAKTIRVTHLVWDHLGITELATIFNGNARYANPVAALPSLHAAWPFMILLFLWPRIGMTRWVLLAYNVAMVLVLVYGAEHYVSDILMGWIYAVIVFVVVNRIMDRQAAKAASRPASSITAPP